jgi:hypothetical protein
MKEKFAVKNRNVWKPLAKAIEGGISLVQSGKLQELNFGVITGEPGESRFLSLEPVISGWKATLFLDGHDYIERLDGKLGLESLGWKRGKEGDLGPVRLFSKATSNSAVAWALIAALQLSESIQESSWFTFGLPEDLGSEFDKGELWVHPSNDAILCLPVQK